MTFICAHDDEIAKNFLDIIIRWIQFYPVEAKNGQRQFACVSQ